ncbi:MAG: hypothetical protein ACFFAH_07515 [Promethearchaeota archaeon]
MGIEGLTQFELLHGFLGLISIGVSIIIGLKISSKYFKNKQIELLTVGLMMIFVTSGWWGATISFLLYVLFNMEISDKLYIFFSYGLIPISFMFWIYSFSHLVYPISKWKIVSIFLVINIIYEIFFIYFLFLDSNLIAIRITRFDTETKAFLSLYILFVLLTTIITNFIFVRESMKLDSAKIRWRSRFIFLGVIIFIIGTTLDTIFPLSEVMLFITRFLLMFSAFLSYIGWTMPDRVARWLIKEEE